MSGKGGGGSQGRAGGKQRGAGYRHELRQDRVRLPGEDDGRPTEEQIEILGKSINYGKDYTNRDLQFLKPTTPSDLKGIFGDLHMQQASQRPSTMDFSTPEYDAYRAYNRLKDIPGDRSTFGGMLHDTFYKGTGEMRGIEDIWDKITKDPEADFQKNSNPFHSIRNQHEQSVLSRQFQDYQQYYQRRVRNEQKHREEVEALRKQFQEEDIEAQLNKLDEYNRDQSKYDIATLPPIPELDMAAMNDELENGLRSYYQQREVQTMHESELFALFPQIALIYNLFNPRHDNEERPSEVRVFTRGDEARMIKQSAQDIRDSVKDLTPESLTDLFTYDADLYTPEEQRRRMDIFFRQQYALLEDLSDQGVLDVPLLSDRSKEQTATKMKTHLHKYVLPQVVHSQMQNHNNNNNNIPSPLTSDTYFSSTLPPHESLEYRLDQLVKGKTVTNANQNQIEMLSQLHQKATQLLDNNNNNNNTDNLTALNQSIRGATSPVQTSWYDRVTNLFNPFGNPSDVVSNDPKKHHDPNIFPQFLSTGQNIDLNQQGEKDTLFSRIKSIFSDNNNSLHPLAEIVELDLQHDIIKQEQKHHNDILFNLKSDPYGKSSRELAAEHMHALNTNTYFNTNTPKGQLLEQIEQLQTLLRNPNIPPAMKGQIKIYQQQAFLAYYQIEKDEREGKFDPIYLKEQEEKKLMKLQDEKSIQSDQQFGHFQSQSGYTGTPESQFATQRRTRRENEYNILNSMGNNTLVDNGNNHHNDYFYNLSEPIPFVDATISKFRPIYEHHYKEPPMNPIKKRFDMDNPLFKTTIEPKTKPHHPCDYFEDAYRHCVLDHNQNIIPCRKEFKTFKVCMLDHSTASPGQIGIQTPQGSVNSIPYHHQNRNIGSLYDPTTINSEIQTAVRRPTRQSFVDTFTLDTTFPIDK